MRGKLPHDYATQGSTLKTKKRDGDQTDIKGLRATVSAEECMPEQQRAVAASLAARLHLCPPPTPTHTSQEEPQRSPGARGSGAKPASAEPACFRGWGTPHANRGGHGTRADVTTMTPFPKWPPHEGDEAFPTLDIMQVICKWCGK